MTGFVLDIDAWAEAAQAYHERTGKTLTIGMWQALCEGSPAPFMSTVMAAEFARQNADVQADYDQFREEMGCYCPKAFT